MKEIKKICFIADGYPSEYRVVNAFVENLVNAFVDVSIQCIVIAPQSINKALKIRSKIFPYKRFRATFAGNHVLVYTPKYISASAKKIGPLNTAYITLHNFKKACLRCFEKINKSFNFDAVYGHFIFESGIVANYIGQKYKIPAFFAYGENTSYSIDYLGVNKTRQLLDGISGVVSVSSVNKSVLVEKKIVPNSRIEVFPNAIDGNLFWKRNLMEMREKLNLPKDDFIVAFVGRFLPVKGVKCLSESLKLIEKEHFSAMFIGEGPMVPFCKKTVFCGTVAHECLGEYLSAADIFVLPTLAEGCCNAIIEAMACGLPVVSSNLPFNDDILDDECSIRINPESVSEIAEAIKKLYDDSALRRKMSAAALKKASGLTIDKRAKAILLFMNDCIKE